jgi:hypothetical protein
MNIDILVEEGIIAEDSLKFESPSFDSAIIGVDYFGRLIYDYEQMIVDFMKINNVSYEEAVEFIDYNTLRSLGYYKDNAPIILITNGEEYE